MRSWACHEVALCLLHHIPSRYGTGALETAAFDFLHSSSDQHFPFCRHPLASALQVSTSPRSRMSNREGAAVCESRDRDRICLASTPAELLIYLRHCFLDSEVLAPRGRQWRFSESPRAENSYTSPPTPTPFFSFSGLLTRAA